MGSLRRYGPQSEATSLLIKIVAKLKIITTSCDGVCLFYQRFHVWTYRIAWCFILDLGKTSVTPARHVLACRRRVLLRGQGLAIQRDARLE